MSIKPYIDGDVVRKIEIGGKIIPARNQGINLSDLPQVVQALNLLIEHLDFEAIGEAEEEAEEWSRDEIFDFLEDRNSRQIMFFRILSENEEIDRERLVQTMAQKLERRDFGGRSLAGILAGIGIRTNSLGKEPLYEKDWQEDEGEWVCYYKLSASYTPIIREWLEEES